MSIIHDYLYDTWNEKGLVEDEDTIQENLQHLITCEQALEVKNYVLRFIETINEEEGEVRFNAAKERPYRKNI